MNLHALKVISIVEAASALTVRCYMVQASGSDDADDDAEAARLEAEREAKQRALNENQFAKEALVKRNPELRSLTCPFPNDKCAYHAIVANVTLQKGSQSSACQ